MQLSGLCSRGRRCRATQAGELGAAGGALGARGCAVQAAPPGEAAVRGAAREAHLAGARHAAEEPVSVPRAPWLLALLGPTETFGLLWSVAKLSV